MGDVVAYVVAAVAAVVIGRWLLTGAWRALGAYRIRRAGPRRLHASRHRLWREPGAASLDPVHGPGSAGVAPAAPFRFVKEHTSGSQPCVAVRDARNRLWRVKWGHEVRCETFAVRVAWACGYFAEVTYFIPDGVIEGAAGLQRARSCVDAETGRFCDARFELEDPSVRTLFEEHSWAWDDNPFIGTPQLSGLKMVVMLLSNWDTKDRRDVARGSNTAIFEYRVSRWRHEARYLLTDWGGSMGRWGSNVATRGRWDVEGFEEQTPQFVQSVDDGIVQFGYTGQRTADIAHGIPVQHVHWLAPYLARLDDEFLTRALLESGATAEEAGRFAGALRDRIRQLQDVAQQQVAPSRRHAG